jgi:hypothetical protein
MPKNSVFLFVLGLLLIGLTGSSTLAVPPGLDVSMIEPVLSQDETNDQMPAIKSPNRQVGDSIYVFCDLATFTFGAYGGSDCWGYNAPGGDSYAIMGVFNGIAFVNTTTISVAAGPSGAISRPGDNIAMSFRSAAAPTRGSWSLICNSYPTAST